MLKDIPAQTIHRTFRRWVILSKLYYMQNNIRFVFKKHWNPFFHKRKWKSDFPLTETYVYFRIKRMQDKRLALKNGEIYMKKKSGNLSTETRLRSYPIMSFCLSVFISPWVHYILYTLSCLLSMGFPEILCFVYVSRIVMNLFVQIVFWRVLILEKQVANHCIREQKAFFSQCNPVRFTG